MEKELNERFIAARKSSNLVELRKLYEENPGNNTIKFGYAKALKKLDIDLAKKLLKELIGTPNENYALLELGNIARSNKNYFLAKKYFNDILNGSNFSEEDKNIAILEIGKLEVMLGNTDKARQYFNSLKGTSNEYYGLLEIGKLELNAGNISVAEELFIKCLSSDCWANARLWLGRIETIIGKYLNALIYLNELLNSPLKQVACREIEKVQNLQLNESNKIKKISRR